ncbi:hypothetical protein EWH08_19525 [Sphingobium indicum]|uniref:N-acetyltransferase domain-containing protein n=2 Tax=Sphingomonadaceae TaxID=41297 RepID=A0A4Q4ITC5_9SPHN|nr:MULTISPECIES: hypothetical protein [Sphingomonadaceae]NYI24983.1 hypothetical protein [Sphingobium indicum]RYL96743.1 hypothetical protein EWH08_19525 [Sphingobium indicum]
MARSGAAAGDSTSHPNNSMIAKRHNAGELIVLKAGNDIAAFALGAFDLIDIFKTKPPFRRIGIGRTLAHY